MSQPAISASTPAPFLRRAITWLRRALRRRRTPDCGVVGLGRGLGFGFLLWRQGHGPGP